MADILREVVLEDRPEVLKDQETRWRLEDAVERSKARERARGIPFVGTVRFSVYGAWFTDQARALAKRSLKRMAN